MLIINEQVINMNGRKINLKNAIAQQVLAGPQLTFVMAADARVIQHADAIL